MITSLLRIIEKIVLSNKGKISQWPIFYIVKGKSYLLVFYEFEKKFMSLKFLKYL